MNLVTQIAKDIAFIGGVVSDIALSGKEKAIVDIAARWISYAADNIQAKINGGAKLEDLVMKDPQQRIEEYLQGK